MARRLLAMLAILVLAGTAFAADRASSGSRGGTADPAIAGVWSGHYFYPNNSNPPVPFELRVTSTQGVTFRGRTSEPNTFGDPGVRALYADVVGSVGLYSSIRFEKTYDGTGGVDHSVNYAGTLDAAGQRIEGSWSIGNTGGRFEMQRVE